VRVSLTVKLAFRTLGRNPRRTLLSVVGVGVGCAVVLFLTGFMRGGSEMRLRAISQSGMGHMRIAPPEWEQTRDDKLRLQEWQAELDAARATEAVRVAAPHARSMALLAFGTRVAGVVMLGVDPEAELAFSRVAGAVTEGRYLESGDRDVTVIGGSIAERLDVELGDDLFLTVVNSEGEMEYAMLRIVGVIRTGSSDLDATICHVTLDDVERLTGLEGAGEITITVDDTRRIEETALRLSSAARGDDVVLTWQVIVPAQGGDAASDRAFSNLLIGIVVVVVTLGIMSAQLTAILERKREIAVLMALGMKGTQVIRMVVLEAAVLGILGTFAGLLLGAFPVYYTATEGFNFAAIMGDDLNIGGVLVDPVVYADMGVWMLPYTAAVALLSAVLASFYPAWYAMKTDPTSALSLREA